MTARLPPRPLAPQPASPSSPPVNAPTARGLALHALATTLPFGTVTSAPVGEALMRAQDATVDDVARSQPIEEEEELQASPRSRRR